MVAEKEVKAVGKMTAEECLAELKELAKEVEFDTKFTKKTPLKELRALVQEGRDALAEDEGGEESEDSDLGGTDDESSEDEESDSDESDSDEEDEDADESDDSEESKDSDKGKSAPRITGPVIPGVPRGEKAITVVPKNGETRTYSKSTHGQHWQTLAKQYAENMKGSKVIKH